MKQNISLWGESNGSFNSLEFGLLCPYIYLKLSGTITDQLQTFLYEHQNFLAPMNICK